MYKAGPVKGASQALGWITGMDKEAVYVGIDVSSTHVDVDVLPDGEVWRVSNDSDGHSYGHRAIDCTLSQAGSS